MIFPFTPNYDYRIYVAVLSWEVHIIQHVCLTFPCLYVRCASIQIGELFRHSYLVLLDHYTANMPFICYSSCWTDRWQYTHTHTCHWVTNRRQLDSLFKRFFILRQIDLIRSTLLSICEEDLTSREPFTWKCYIGIIMTTSSNGNSVRVTGPLCEEFTGHRWIPLTKASDAELWGFLWSLPE